MPKRKATPKPKTKQKLDEREYLAHELFKLMKTYREKHDGDDDYAAYVLFSILGRMIADVDGPKRLNAYIKDIKAVKW